MSAEWKLRARALLSKQFGTLVLALIILAGVGGVLTYGAYEQPNTSVRTDEVTVWTSDGSFTHRATVIDNASRVGPVFEPGQVVRDRSVYFKSIMPVLNGTFGYRYTADSGDLDVTVRQHLVIRSVGGQGEDGTEYWRRTRTLGTKRATLAPGERVTVPFSVNVTDALATADRIHEQLGDPGETRTSVNVTVTLSGTAGGRPVNRTLQYALPLRPQSGIYRVGAGGDRRAFTRLTRETVRVPPGAFSAIGGPLFVAVGVLGLLVFGAARYAGRLALSDSERAWLEYRDDRSDFDEWISSVRLPEEAERLPVAEADRLADLVDVAIDTDNPVLESPDDDRYFVVHDGYRYTFDAPPDPTASESGEESDQAPGDDMLADATDPAGGETEDSD